LLQILINVFFVQQTKGHTFNLTRFSTPTHCDQCQKLLWGVVYHGYQCSLCDINLHRYCCITELAAECAGQQKVIRGNKGRKQSLLSRNKGRVGKFYYCVFIMIWCVVISIGVSDEVDGSKTDGPLDYTSRSEDDEQVL